MDMTMSSATPTRVEVVTSVQRRRRWTPEQKLEVVKQTNEPGNSVSMVARQFVPVCECAKKLGTYRSGKHGVFQNVFKRVAKW